MYQGTPITMAPEMLNMTPYDPLLSDIWSLGVTFYIMAVGHHPWGSKDFKQVVSMIKLGIVSYPSSLDRRLIDLLKKMINPNPTSRYHPSELLKHPFFAQTISFRAPSLLYAKRLSQLCKSNITVPQKGHIKKRFVGFSPSMPTMMKASQIPASG